MDSSSQNLIDSIAVRILVLVVIFSSIIFSAKADNGKKGNKEKQKEETKVTFSAEETVFFDEVSKEVETKASKAISSILHPKVEIFKVIDATGKVILEKADLNELPVNAEKLMIHGKTAFYIVNL
jgi:hypothetical protein